MEASPGWWVGRETEKGQGVGEKDSGFKGSGVQWGWWIDGE